MVYNTKQRVTAATLGLGILLGSYAFAPQAQADSETDYRLGAMISIPFSLKVTSFFDWQNIRLGLVGQVASVEETKRTFERDYHRVYLDGALQSTTLTGSHQVSSSGSDFVVGGQLEVYFTPFADKIEYGAAAGPVIGSREVQFAGLLGYNNKTGLFGDTGVMFPYSKVGLRMDRGGFTPYAAATTLSAFEEKKITLVRDVYTDTFNVTPVGLPN